MRYAVEKAVIAISVLVGLGILAASIISLYNDFSAGKSFEYLMTDVVFFSFGILLTGGALRLYKQLFTLSTIADDVFDELVFSRLRPVLEEIAYSTVELSEVKAELERLKGEIEKFERMEAMGESLAAGKIAFYMRSIVVSLVYVGAYLFMLNYYMNYTPYLLPVLYLIWWAFITNEFRLFSRFEAWLVMGIPVLIVPAMAIVIQTTFGIAPLMGIVFATSLLYAYLYYLYAQELSAESGGKGGLGLKEKKEEKEFFISKPRKNFLLRKTESFLQDVLRWLKS